VCTTSTFCLSKRALLAEVFARSFCVSQKQLQTIILFQRNQVDDMLISKGHPRIENK